MEVEGNDDCLPPSLLLPILAPNRPHPFPSSLCCTFSLPPILPLSKVRTPLALSRAKIRQTSFRLRGRRGRGGGGEWSAATHRRLTLSGVFFVDPQEGGRKERNRGVKWAESRRRRGGQTAFSSFLLEAAPSPALFPCVSRTGRKGLPGEREEGVENPCTFLPSSLFARRVEQA